MVAVSDLGFGGVVGFLVGFVFQWCESTIVGGARFDVVVRRWRRGKFDGFRFI